MRRLEFLDIRVGKVSRRNSNNGNPTRITNGSHTGGNWPPAGAGRGDYTPHRFNHASAVSASCMSFDTINGVQSHTEAQKAPRRREPAGDAIDQMFSSTDSLRAHS